MSLKNITMALNALLNENEDLRKVCTKVGTGLNNMNIDEAIEQLSEYIQCLECTGLFKKYLSNILLAIVSARIPLKAISKDSEKEAFEHLQYFITLSSLCDHPDILQYALKYIEINPEAPFEAYINLQIPVHTKKRKFSEGIIKICKTLDYQVVKCCYSLLKQLPNELSLKWDWNVFILNFSCYESPEIRWMVKECMVILTNMTELQANILSRNLNLTEDDCLKYLCVPSKRDIVTIEETFAITNSAGVVSIDGILLPIFDKYNVQNGSLVPVKSTLSNLRSIALSVASGKALCLLGPVGSGKTCLVEHLAAITGRKGGAFKKIQLGDQTDSRMLLGSHQCTDVPGEFVWSPGVLTEAVEHGHWLLLEDIDCAALDVASTLSSLLERNALCVPGYRDNLPVSPGFQLFVSQRTLVTNYGFQKKMSNTSTLLQKHLTQINVEPLSRSELAEIIQQLYPSLTTICSRMIEVFMMFSVGSHDTSLQATETNKDNSITIPRGSRLISTRDLMKWCSRSVIGFDVTSPESALKVLQDAIDIFTCSVSSPELRLELTKKVGTCLGIVETKSEFYCKHYKPNVSLTPSALEAGRAHVMRKEKSLESVDFDSKQVVFSFTRQSACLLERIACCIMSNEPVLLVGETGTGKTSAVQYIARQTGHKLTVINMNQQSDSADLLGGYKPVNLKYVIRPIRLEFEALFRSFYNVEKNKKFLNHIETCYEKENWVALLALMNQSHKAAVKRMTNENKESESNKWRKFGRKLCKLDQQIKSAARLTFAFIEGSLVKAMQEGNWVLLDEINLASAEILECIAGLLEDKDQSIDLLEKGDKVPIKRHLDFTLFACMNPATDVGKKDLPVGLRNRFTEFFIDELSERNDLMLLIGDYLYHMNLSGAVLEAIYNFYSTIRKEAKLSLVDGAGNAPHYSLRTLCRALTAAAKAKCGTVSRSLYEAFCLSFLTQLDSSSHPKVEAMIAKAVIGKKSVKSVLNQLIPEPQIKGQTFLLFEGHWIPQGQLDIDIPDGYILTPTVRKNLRDIARIISLSRLPVLLQGDTSVGKTSLITYIAKASGNYCVRINNHEHTDLQEYIGCYATNASGSLVFKEGVLVEAMRKGYWIILDELNLAPSDVLEALNRVLDDNRELFIPETQEVVKADPNFMLFATQNPPGLYGGRKMLSRAFRNRFVELHFDEIPRKELETILHQRCHVPPAYSKKMIAVMAELQIRRRGSAAVQGKDGFITLRDLFRWGQRYKHASKEMLTEDKFYDWDQHIADEGYLVLAGRVRQADERSIIEEVTEKHIKRKVNPDNLFSLHLSTSPVTKSVLEMILNNQLEEFSHIVWTYNMRRLAVLIAKAFTFDEPVLLVGETGCGKTTICQILATLNQRELMSVNCHMHTESSDFLGGLRPVRERKDDNKLFEWVDGPLIKAMESGNMFLADEISLADDSVLERLNSLLEPERQLVLAERGVDNNSDIVVIIADKNFHFIGTMNPGGDFGKKELSPALRNRFTEIWCDSVSSRHDLLKVLEKSVSTGISLGNQEDGSSGIGNSILDFVDYLKNSDVTNKFPFSIRDLLSWVQFVNTTVSKRLLDTPEAYVHGACMTFLDCFGTALTGHIDPDSLISVRKHAINYLLKQIETIGTEYIDNLKTMLSEKHTKFTAEFDGYQFGIKPFYIEVGNFEDVSEVKQNFSFTAPTTGSNTLRLLRGLQLNKAILLEGNPGVGKTSLVTALAKSTGHRVVRINLSDQTDITDLFGTDLPSDDGLFKFKEGAFLNALQNGDWILLDEMNLAPQPVLEGLNACLDHRGEVFIPELGKTFKVKKQTRLFACQNPLKQGGARRGLPLSFLNRFTQVYIDTLTRDDLIYIVESQYPTLPKDVLHKIVAFNCKVAHEITEIQSWGHRGSPWEMNLRDIQRWCDALEKDRADGKSVSPGKFVDILYINRMRTAEDKDRMVKEYDDIFYPKYPRSNQSPQFDVDHGKVYIGDVDIDRKINKIFINRRAAENNLQLLRSQLPALKSLAQCVKMNWMSILVGPTATGKSSIIEILADLTGNDLQVLPVTSTMDVSDLLGGFEQVDYHRILEGIHEKLHRLSIETVRNMWLRGKSTEWDNTILKLLHKYREQYSSLEYTECCENRVFGSLPLLYELCTELIQYNKNDHGLDRMYRIIRRLQKFDNKLKHKFDYVDSLLVKAMLNGSWLVLDNVNLTSAAVLDRLNGLLETNGVLSIPERGVFSEIRPHPNFRIFFTMDPKYGEISRAMRNRGVEIFLLKPDDLNMKLCETITYLDLEALLTSSGLSNKYHQVSVDCHELLSSFIEGLERPTTSHLLQAAVLTHQQILRGIDCKKAMLNSFSDVYIKPRCGTDFISDVKTSLAEMKNIMLQALKKLLDEAKFEDAKDTGSHSTIVIKELCSNASFEIAKQLSYPVLQQNLDNSLNVLFNFFTTYQRCTQDNINSVHTIIQNHIGESKESFKNQSQENQLTINLLNLSDQLNDVAFTCLKIDSDHVYLVELHKMFYPEQYILNNQIINDTNVLTLTLYFELLVLLANTNDRCVSGLNALDYAKAVSSGGLDELYEYPILKYCAQYLETIDENIKLIFKQLMCSSDGLVNNRKACLILQLLNWRSRFLQICFEPLYILEGSRKVYRFEEVVPLLYIHSKWLEKHLLGELFKLAQNSTLENAVKKRLTIIAHKNDDENIEMGKLGKKLRKFYGQPKLYKNQNEYQMCVNRSDIYTKLTLDLNQTVECQLPKLSTSSSNILCMDLAFDVPENDSLSFINTVLATKLPEAGTEVKLLPLRSYVLQKMLNILMSDLSYAISWITEEENQNVDAGKAQELSRVLGSVVNLGKMCAGVCPALVNMLELVQSLVQTKPVLFDKRLSSLAPRFWDELYKALVRSPAWYPEPFLNFKKSINEDTIMEAPVHTKRMSPNTPLMPYYVQKITVSDNDEGSSHLLSYETVSLEQRDIYSAQLNSVLHVLWKNIAVLDTATPLKLRTDAIFEMNKYERLIFCIHTIVANSHEDSEMKTDHQTLNDYFKNDSSLLDTMVKANVLYKELASVMDNLEVKKVEAKILIAQLSLLTSIIFVRIMSEMTPVDQVEKYQLKAKYANEDIAMFDNLLSSYYIVGLVTGTIASYRKIDCIEQVTPEDRKVNKESLKAVHPYCEALMEMREKTAEKIYKYAVGNTFRPAEPSYNNFAKDCKHFTKSVLAPKTVQDVASNLIETCNVLYQSGTNNQSRNVIQNSHIVLKETASWIYSVQAFYKKIKGTYSDAFPDLAKPLLSSLSQTTYSVTCLLDLIKELIAKTENGPILKEVVTDLMEYPTRIPRVDDKEKFMNRFVSENVLQLCNRNIVAGKGDTLIADVECMRLLKMNLTELSMRCTALERIDNVSVKSVLATLTAIVKAWEKQQRDIEKKKQDDEALYVTKSKCEDEDEDAMAYQEMKEMFPSHSDQDFSEFKPITLEQTPAKITQNLDNKTRPLITPEDVSLVYKWHSNFVRNLTTAEWLPSPKKLVGNDVISAFLQRYPTFSQVMQNAWEALDAEFEGEISPSLMVLISQIRDKIDGCESTSSKVDFYRSPWVSETKQCVPLLHRVKEATNNLLDQWPDFPTLKDIIVIVDRIANFPVTSPISRFLTGLELLRDKIEEWNKAAHKGNNMIDISLAVGQQIINWRKLEMAHWKECLNNLYQRKQSEAHKYWFYLYSVVMSYLDEHNNEPATSDRVVSVLKDFLETSNLAEYEVRLDIVYTYHCHLVHLPQNPRRDELLSILWNTHNYYSQFRLQVASHIKEKRAPIEKKLRDFVKICTWDRDLSYWSVKDTVEKAHKALHKHTKEFENILKESVSSCLVDNTSEVGSDHVGIWDRPKRATGANGAAGGAYMIDPQNHIVLARNVKKYLDQAELPSPVIADGSLLSKVSSLLNKAKTLCKETISNTGYPALVQGLDDFVTIVIETSTHLGSLEVDTNEPKDKQTSQAKNIVQQKRKALADLFKYLTKMGLNYRTGLVVLSASENLYDFTIPPVDLDAAISYLKSRRCDASLALLWSGCEKYFQKNIARHRLLAGSLLSPHQDLGVQNIERCKGFAAQLLKLTNIQKKSISKYSRQLCDLRSLVTNLTNVIEIDTDTNVATLNDTLDILTECYANTSILLDQFSILLKSCPEKDIGDTYAPEFDSVLSNSPIVKCYKNTDEWNELYSKIKLVISKVSKQTTALHKLRNQLPTQVGGKKITAPVVSQAHIDVANNAKATLQGVIGDVDGIIQKYQIKFNSVIDKDFVPKHPLLRSIVNLSNYLKDIDNRINQFENLNESAMEDNTKAIIEQTEDLVATTLLIIQSVYKKHLPEVKNSESTDVLKAIDEIIDDKQEKEESKEILEDNHLKNLLIEKLRNDSEMLQLDTLTNKLNNLLLNYTDLIASNFNVSELKNVVMRLVPILEQAMLFVQYFVTQKVAVHRVSCKMLSVLLKIFSDLATKGFCKPSDLDMEDGEGDGGAGKLTSGTGLGDGEGQKDVSDKIENQDQLDDARKPGEEKNEEERDCKEEEKGINMSDDFDSHLQDVEKKEGDDENEEEEEDEADKQMGDIDHAAEKLDQQIWGSEDEDDVDEEQEKNEKEEKGKGESTGEKEMGAKQEEQGTDDGAEGKDKKKKKDINEMDEPEVDDDHVDPYHGNQQPLPEPEDFELPDNMDVDGDEPADDDKEGETETENPFEIDVMKENIEEEEKEDKGQEEKENRNGLDVSSDEEGDEADDDKEKGGEGEDKQDKEEDSKEDKPDNEDENMEGTEEDTIADNAEQNPEDTETPENNEEPKDELPKNPDSIVEEDETDQKNQEANPQANPSNDDPSAGDKAENAEMERGTDDNVETNAQQKKDEESAPYEQSQEQVGEDKQSQGRSELDKSEKGHRGDKQAASHADRSQEKQQRHENKPGKTDQERTLGDVNENKHKQSHTLNVENEEQTEDGGDGDKDEETNADAYQHVKQAKKDDLQVVDAATKEQADQQPILDENDDETAEEMKPDEEVPMDVDEVELQVNEKSEELKPEKMKEGSEKEKDKSGTKKEKGEEPTGEAGMEVEGDTILTEHVPRGIETSYHSRVEDTQQRSEELSVREYLTIRWSLSGGVSGAAGAGGAAAGVWRALWRQEAAAARALTERLRLVLEPTARSRKAGDFRTGRAINMRRVIPYIASQFRKDRIWLRRTKPAKREYKIAIAVDDSSSMADNRSKELAFESLALVSQALNLLESGDLAVLSFGETTNLLHPFTEQFSEHSGSKILQQLRFEQTKTKIAQLLDFCTVMFEEQAVRSDALNAKLLVVVSDGRGIFSEGETKVIQAVRRARQQGIFLVYVIIDNPDNKDSIMDIRRPIVDPVTNTVSFVQYLDTFPFPFYLILRDMSALPNVLGDALRQWFELAANIS